MLLLLVTPPSGDPPAPPPDPPAYQPRRGMRNLGTRTPGLRR